MAGACTRRRDERECVMEPVPQADYTATRQRNCNHTQKPNINAYVLFIRPESNTDKSYSDRQRWFLQGKYNFHIHTNSNFNQNVHQFLCDYCRQRLRVISKQNVLYFTVKCSHQNVGVPTKAHFCCAIFLTHTNTQHKWNGFYFTNITTTKRFCVFVFLNVKVCLRIPKCFCDKICFHTTLQICIKIVNHHHKNRKTFSFDIWCVVEVRRPTRPLSHKCVHFFRFHVWQHIHGTVSVASQTIIVRKENNMVVEQTLFGGDTVRKKK